MADDVTCGTTAGVRAHRRAGEELCGLCAIVASRRLGIRPKVRPQMHHERWSVEDILFLRSHADENPESIAGMMGRSATSVHHAGLKYVKGWNWWFINRDGHYIFGRRHPESYNGGDWIGLRAME